MSSKKPAPKHIIKSLTTLYKQKKYKQLNSCLPNLLEKYKDLFLMKIAVCTLKDQNKAFTQLCSKAYKQFKDEWFIKTLNPTYKLNSDCWFEICKFLSTQDLGRLRSTCTSLNTVMSQGIFFDVVECTKKTEKQLSSALRHRQDIKLLKLTKCKILGSNNLCNLVSLTLVDCDISMKLTSRLIQHSVALKHLSLTKMLFYGVFLNNKALHELYLNDCSVGLPLDAELSFTTIKFTCINTSLDIISSIKGISHLCVHSCAIIDVDYLKKMDLESLSLGNVQFQDKDNFYLNLSTYFPKLHIIHITDPLFNKKHLMNLKSLDLIELHLCKVDCSTGSDYVEFPSLRKLTLRECQLNYNIPVTGPVTYIDLALNINIMPALLIDFIKKVAFTNGKLFNKIDVGGCYSLQQHHLSRIAKLTELLDITDLHIPLNFYSELQGLTKVVWRKTNELVVDRANEGRQRQQQRI
eukprot:NODE_209_length_14693_cov_0.335617.p2 type:complete len:465 gc:universal NODE_209_length_14693_cov_0.335617:5366-6760(+)